MSRTIRRQHAPHEKRWHVPDLTRISEWDLRREGVATAQAFQVRRQARFHGDNHPGEWNAPSWFARVLNKKVARATTAALHRGVRQDEWEGFVCPRYLNNANWNWW